MGTQRRKRAMAAVILALCVLGASMLAQVSLRKKTKKTPSEVSTMDFSSPSKEYIYAGGRLVATEEPTAAPLSAPSNLVATVSPSSAGQINLSWTASAGAVDHYQIERSENFSLANNGFSFVANVTGTPLPTSYTDTPPGSGVRAYMYRVRAADASSQNFSAYSNNDLATTIIFTDASVQNQLIKAVHLTELRQTVDAVRKLANPITYPPVNWSDPSPQGVLIKAQHMLDLRSNLNPALNALGMPQVSPDSTLAVGQPIKAVHLQDVRDKVK
ncbi:MAG TPA: hypothetical protein VGL29_23150 [Blastocatellia bacterium]